MTSKGKIQPKSSLRGSITPNETIELNKKFSVFEKKFGQTDVSFEIYAQNWIDVYVLGNSNVRKILTFIYNTYGSDPNFAL